MDKIISNINNLINFSLSTKKLSWPPEVTIAGYSIMSYSSIGGA